LLQESRREFNERDVCCILSIGTGLRKVTALKQSEGLFRRIIPLDLIEVLKSMTTSAERVGDEMNQRFQDCPGLYYRLNVDRGLENVSLEEWSQLANVKTHTLAYLNRPDVSRAVDEVVDALLGRSTHRYPLQHLGN
jgi:hypothetical protein